MAMNYANLGLCQIDIAGIDLAVNTEQQLPAGTYNKILDAIKNGKIVALVNCVYTQNEVSFNYSSMIVTASTGVDSDNNPLISLECGINGNVFYVSTEDVFTID